MTIVIGLGGAREEAQRALVGGGRTEGTFAVGLHLEFMAFTALRS
jgi:hypothetical protein